MISVAVGGGLGAVCRYAIGLWINKRNKNHFPIGTLFINALGSFLLGYLSKVGVSESLWLFLGTGFMGGFTTFSTFGYESMMLLQKKNYKTAATYVLSSIIICIAFTWLGLYI